MTSGFCAIVDFNTPSYEISPCHSWKDPFTGATYISKSDIVKSIRGDDEGFFTTHEEAEKFIKTRILLKKTFLKEEIDKLSNL
jgi:hypothetical protein